MRPHIELIEPEKGLPFWYGCIFGVHKEKIYFFDTRLGVDPLFGMRPSHPHPSVVATILKRLHFMCQREGIEAYEDYAEKDLKKPREQTGANLPSTFASGEINPNFLGVRIVNLGEEDSSLTSRWDEFRKMLDKFRNGG